MIDWGLKESVTGWSELDSCSLFPEQFKILRWAGVSFGYVTAMFAVSFFAGITLLFMGQELLACVLIFGSLVLVALSLCSVLTSYTTRIVLSRDRIIVFHNKSIKQDFTIVEIEQVAIEIESTPGKNGRKRLALFLKSGEKVPLCPYRKEWEEAEVSLMDALRTREVRFVVPGYE